MSNGFEFVRRWCSARSCLLPFFIGFIFIAMSPTLTAGKYVGVGKCRVCQLQQAKSWEGTRMAKAFDLLKPGMQAEQKKAHGLDPQKDYTHDPGCLLCHTTGYGQPGGFVSIEATPHLAGVQCEMCHGAGEGYLKPDLMSLQNKEYKRANLMAAGLVVPNAKTCAFCHNEKSPFVKKGAPFNFEQRKAQGTHQHLALKFAH